MRIPFFNKGIKTTGDDHPSDLELARFGIEGLSGSSQAHSVDRHLQSCEACRTRAFSRRAPNQGFQAASLCDQYEDSMAEMAVGLLAEEKAIGLRHHLESCGRCSASFAVLTRDLNQEPSVKELAEISGPIGPSWASLPASASDSAIRERKPAWLTGSRNLRVWSWAAAGLAMAGLAVVLFWNLRTTPEKTMRLLAQAYTEQRTLELRIADARNAPMRVERGASDASRMNRPAALLQAEALIAGQLRVHPDSPAWLGAKTRADLLDWHYQAAIETADRGLALEPDSVSLLIDSASAYFERAEALGRSADYGEAEERLGKALALVPNNPVARYNRALVREHLQQFDGAIQDWNSYLAADHTSDWAREAQRHLAAIQQKRSEHELRFQTPLMSATEIAMEFRKDTKADLAALDPRAEEYLDEAVRHWLPALVHGSNGRSKRTLRDALEAVAKDLEQAHHDEWLKDMLRPDLSAAFTAGVENLGIAEEENASGDASLAYSTASIAERNFRRAGVQPGVMRAVVEQLYALQRSTEGRACVQHARTMESAVLSSRYPSVKTAFLIEKAICLNMTGELGAAKRDAATALAQTRAAAYEVLSLRATSLNASLEWSAGDPVLAFSIYQAGLASYWAGVYPPMRAYNFYVNLGHMANAYERWHLAESMFAEAVHSVPPRENPSMEAMARTELAKAAVLAGDAEVADAEFRRSKELFAGMAESQAKNNLLAESEIGLAQTAALKGEWRRAILLLNEAAPQLKYASSRFLTLSYYATLGEAQWSLRHLDEAEKALRSAVSVAEGGQRSLLTQFERLEWRHRYDEAFRTLVQIKVDRGQAEQAFRLWESYLAIPMSRALVSGVRVPAATGAEQIQHEVEPRDKRFLVTYAFLPHAVVVWTRSGEGAVVQYKIATPIPLLRKTALAFIQQCADRSSKVEDLYRSGNTLFGTLIQPFAAAIEDQQVIVIEPDDALSALPFEALITNRGAYLGEHHQIIISPGHAYGRERQAVRFDVSDRVLVVTNPYVKELDEELTPLPQAINEGKLVAAKFSDVVMLTGSQATAENVMSKLPQAKIFHFAGHTISIGDQEIALVLASPTQLAATGRNLSAALLNRRALRQCALVVLSACATARSNQSGLGDASSLVRAFLGAGVHDVVASRWNVDSASTTSFMKEFYAALLSGHSVPESVEIASKAIRTEQSHPFYWAAFAAFGQS